jgi:DNA-binding NarL/FixJ family response regulator
MGGAHLDNFIPDPARAHRTMTPRRIQYLQLIADGNGNKQIARKLGITLDGARCELSKIYRALGVDNRTSAAVEAWQRGLIK